MIKERLLQKIVDIDKVTKDYDLNDRLKLNLIINILNS